MRKYKYNKEVKPLATLTRTSCFERSNQSVKSVQALKQALQGDHLLNVRFPDGPESDRSYAKEDRYRKRTPRIQSTNGHRRAGVR